MGREGLNLGFSSAQYCTVMSYMSAFKYIFSIGGTDQYEIRWLDLECLI